MGEATIRTRRRRSPPACCRVGLQRSTLARHTGGPGVFAHVCHFYILVDLSGLPLAFATRRRYLMPRLDIIESNLPSRSTFIVRSRTTLVELLVEMGRWNGRGIELGSEVRFLDDERTTRRGRNETGVRRIEFVYVPLLLVADDKLTVTTDEIETWSGRAVYVLANGDYSGPCSLRLQTG